MDEIAEYNQIRWRALAQADALFTRPKLNLDEFSARKLIDSEGKLGDLNGKDILCLAGGGGQQSAAFAVLGANVSVLDLSSEQLERDRQAARHYSVEIKTAQGDMRDLSIFENDSFDIVIQPYSINFVPETGKVFRQVANVLRNGGIYVFNFANPFTMGIQPTDWCDNGYILKNPYNNKARISYEDQNWVYDRETVEKIPNPVEFRHTLSDVFNNLIENNFVISHVSDQKDMFPDETAEPGTWDHFVAFAPPWLNVLAHYKPDFKI